MKKYRHNLLRALIFAVLAAFTITMASAQENEKEEKKIKLKILKDDGKYMLDTVISLGSDFDGDWSRLIKDEDILKDLEDLQLNIKGSKKGEVIIKSPGKSSQSYMYVTTEDEGDARIILEMKESDDGLEDVFMQNIKGDSAIKLVVVKSAKTEGDEYKSVIWRTEGDVMKITHDILLDEMDADSARVIIVSKGEGKDNIKISTQKEVFIIVEDDNSEKKNDKDKKQKKKKEK